MKILYVTTIGLTMIFFKDLARELIENGNTVDIAANEKDYRVDPFYHELGCHMMQVDFSRSPLSKGNVRAYQQLRKIISENHYDIVHCHTPVAGAITRLACRKFRKNGLRVIYTAHGFHFYKGAPLKNWLIYYPIEKLCSYFTDVLITINHEDYELAKKKMKAKRVEYVPGVGVDVDRFANAVVDRAAKRRELGIPEDAFLLLSVGELNENKNHQIVIRALAELKDPNIHYMIAGQGPLRDYLSELAQKLGVAEQVHLLGYRKDVAELYKTADIYILPSLREGLNVSLLEAKAAGLPAICGKIRGNVDIADREHGDILIEDEVENYKNAVLTLKCHENSSEQMMCGSNLVKAFSAEKVINRMLHIYVKAIRDDTQVMLHGVSS